jgi:HD-GYP domain-containing protein (c-di-GMP phosphodiesterase class II)
MGDYAASSVHGVKWVEGIDYLKPAIPLIRHHHERWDGNGYPDGLRETEIPLPARIFSIVDVWDALLSTRPYRAAWTRGQVVGYLTENAGRQFDPEIVDIFYNAIKK